MSNPENDLYSSRYQNCKSLKADVKTILDNEILIYDGQ